MSKALALPNNYQQLLSANNMTNVKHFEGLYTEIAVSQDGYIAIYHSHIPEETVRVTAFKKQTFPEQQERFEVLHISQINDVDIDVDGTEVTKVSGGLGGALVGGLLGGTLGAVIGSAATSGKVSSDTTYEAVTLIINTKDFNNPRIEVPLYQSPALYGGSTVIMGDYGALRIAAFPSGLRSHLRRATGSPFWWLTEEGNRLHKEMYSSGQPNFTVVEELHSTLMQLLNAQQQNETAAASAPQLSAADELAKFKSLLDSGVITQEEFDAKKKQLLGL